MIKFINTLSKNRIYIPDYNSNKIPAEDQGKRPEEAIENWNNNYLKIATEGDAS